MPQSFQGPEMGSVGRFRLGSAVALWIAATSVTTVMAADAQAVSVEDPSLTLDDAWFASLARAECRMSAATSRGEADSTDRIAVAAQIGVGVDALGSIVLASVGADTLLALPLATVSPQEPPHRSRGYPILRATGVVSAMATLGHLIAGMSGASPQTRTALGYLGGSAAGIVGVFSAWTARSPEHVSADDVLGFVVQTIRDRLLLTPNDLASLLPGRAHALELTFAGHCFEPCLPQLHRLLRLLGCPHRRAADFLGAAVQHHELIHLGPPV